MKTIEKIKNLYSKKPLYFVALILILAFASYFVYSIFISQPLYSPYFEYPALQKETFYRSEALTTEKTKEEIKYGYVEINSKDVEKDSEKIKDKVKELNGWIERMNRWETESYITLSLSIKVSKENFENLSNWVIENFDVKSINLGFYKVELKRQKGEIEILLNALKIYEELMKKAESLELNQSVDVIMKITEKKLEIMRLLKQYGYYVEEVEEMADYPTININLKQEKEIKIFPEDLGKELMKKLKNGLAEITDSLLNLIILPIVLLIKIFTWIIYAFIVIIPIFIAYKFIKKALKWIEKKF